MGDAIPVTLQSLHHSISLQKEDFVNCMLCAHRVILSMSTMTVLMLEDMERRSPNVVSIFVSQTTPIHLVGKLVMLYYSRKFEQSTVMHFPLLKYTQINLSIEQLVKRKRFTTSCEKWRSRSVPDGFICDIYDGLIRRKFNSADGANFLSSPHCWLLTLNVDLNEGSTVCCQLSLVSAQQSGSDDGEMCE